MIEAAHPVPDEASLAGGRRLLELAQAAGPDDLVIGLVTGGSSALAVCPAEGITMADKVATNRLLLGCGADIVAINNVRKHLSRHQGRSARPGLRLRDRQLHGVRRGRRSADCLTDLLVPDRSTCVTRRRPATACGLWDHLPRRVGGAPAPGGTRRRRAATGLPA